MRLDQKVAVVTGASRGVGEAVARRFASEGACVVIADLDAGRGVQVAADIQAAGGKALFAETDVRDELACRAAVDAAVEHFGGLHILVNNAAATLMTMGGQEMPVIEQPIENFDAILSVSVNGTFLCCKAAIPEIIRSGGGSIINVSSIAAMQGMTPALFFASDESEVITGSELLVDGGGYSRGSAPTDAIRNATAAAGA